MHSKAKVNYSLVLILEGDNMKKIPLIVIMLIGSLLIFIGSTRQEVKSETTMEELEEQRIEAEESILESQKNIQASNSILATMLLDISEADLLMSQVETEIFNIQNSIVLKEEEILKNKLLLEEAKKNEDFYYEQTKKRIKIVYEYGSTEYIEVLLESKDTSDFFNRLEYLNKLVNYDQDMLGNLVDIQAGIVEHEEQLKLEKLELESLKADAEVKKNEVEEVRVTKQKEILKIEDDKELDQENIRLMEEEQIKIDAMIEELIRLYSDMDLVYGGGNLTWPVPGWNRISSVFGPRIHPVWGYASVHTGIDIPAGYGVDIVAAASGRVIFAGWGNAYGNYILVDHGVDEDGNHIVTQYAHTSQMLVVEGDVVIRGDKIAEAGSTGWSTGNHLHFGLRIGGEWVDPESRLD